MNITGTIYTTNKKGIATNRLGHIYDVIKTTGGVKLVKFDVVEIDLPDDVVVKKDKVAVRIDWDWLIATYKTGGNVLCLHISRAEHDRLGLKHPNGGRLGGSYNRNIGDTSMEFFIIANTVKVFTQKFLHELSHGFNHWTDGTDKTHHYDYELKNIESIYPTYSFIKYNLLTQIRDASAFIVELLTKKKTTKPTDLLPLVKRKADAVVSAMAKLGHQVRIVEGYRSMERQTELYNQGRTTKGNIVTNAKAGESFHNYGVAVDFVFRKEGYNATNKQWQLLGDIGKAHGFDWGGDWTRGFVDKPHFSFTLGCKLSDFQKGKVDYKKFN